MLVGFEPWKQFILLLLLSLEPAFSTSRLLRNTVHSSFTTCYNVFFPAVILLFPLLSFFIYGTWNSTLSDSLLLKNGVSDSQWYFYSRVWSSILFKNGYFKYWFFHQLWEFNTFQARKAKISSILLIKSDKGLKSIIVNRTCPSKWSITWNYNDSPFNQCLNGSYTYLTGCPLSTVIELDITLWTMYMMYVQFM